MRDKVSGFIGTADVCTEFLTGNVQYSLVPPINPTDKVEAGKPKVFDSYQLEHIADHLEPIAPPENTGIVLGEKVKDIVSGVTGIATLKSTFLNGCVYYTVVPDVTDSPKDLSEMFFEYVRLKRMGAGVAPAIAKRKEAGTIKPTGGPAHYTPRRS
jgi:hypothetical protein